MKTGALFEAASTPASGIVDIVLVCTNPDNEGDLLVDEGSRISRYMKRPDKYAGNPIMVEDCESVFRELGYDA